MTTTWTEEGVALLTRLWCVEGLSGSEIGQRMGLSRSAVISKAHRLGLEQSVQPSAPEPTAPSAPVVEAPPRPSRPPTVPAAKPALAPPPLRQDRSGIPLADLRLGTCRFACTPDGVPADQHRFCGAPAVLGKSWCREHWDVVYVPQDRVARRAKSA